MSEPSVALRSESDEAFPPIAAIVYDMDGLLVDSEPLAEAALDRFLARHGKTKQPGSMELTLGRRLPEAIAIIADLYAIPGDLAVLTDEYDLMRLDALRGKVRPMPGALEMTSWGRARGLRQGWATSSKRAHADLSLNESDLDGRFDAYTYGDEVERGKPEPDMFLLAAHRLGVGPAACLVLEDAPAGLAAAAAAGMRRIWVPNAKTRGLAVPVAIDAVLDDLHAVIPWLAERALASPASTDPPD
ncbi:MAG: HAD family phosphatase [Thermomicrobiales bacterium]|nr:HAD family phosphatase [Thermomicrobiales bacterium]